MIKRSKTGQFTTTERKSITKRLTPGEWDVILSYRTLQGTTIKEVEPEPTKEEQCTVCLGKDQQIKHLIHLECLAEFGKPKEKKTEEFDSFFMENVLGYDIIILHKKDGRLDHYTRSHHAVNADMVFETRLAK